MATRKIGALWKKNGDTGNYYTGLIDLPILGKHRGGLFQNKKKDLDGKEPDVNIVLLEDDEEGG